MKNKITYVMRLLVPLIQQGKMALCTLLGGVLLGIISPTVAQDKLQLFYAWYEDDDGLEVLHPGVILNKDLSEDTTLGLSYVYETFDKSAGADTVSGASVFVGGGTAIHEVRQDTGVNISHNDHGTSYSVGYYQGDEDDYKSRTLVMSLSQELLNKNLTLSTTVAFGRDQVYSSNNTVGFPKDKDVDRLNLSLTQLLTPKSLLVVGGGIERQQGYLSSPNRQIRELTPIIGGFSEQLREESHPAERDRRVYFIRGKQYFDAGAALDLNLSHYSDDWGVNADAAELRLGYYLRSDLLLRWRHRLYRQSEADFYQQTYSAGEQYTTADARLRQFDSRINGLKLSYYPDIGRRDRYVVSFSYDKYGESNQGIEADIMQISIDLPL